MKNYGRVLKGDGVWFVECQPQVMVRIKRVFERIYKGEHGHVTLTDTTENCRELLWFLERYPMEVSDMEYLQSQANEHKKREEIIDNVLAGNYEPATFELAVPPRQYQIVAADLAMKTGRLLLADDVGLGKTASAICVLSDPAARPALVVTLTHLPRQWEAEIKKFAPALRCHIVKKGTPYDITKGKRGKKELFPDVIIMNYHKLSGWADALAPVVKSVVFDECQELRHSGSLKYTAARHVVSSTEYRMGLSATPIYNYGGEIYNVIDCIAPDTLGSNQEFTREWCSHDYTDKPRIADPKAFGMYLRDQGLMLRRTRAEVGRELPPLTKSQQLIEADLEALAKVGPTVAELAKIILTQNKTARGEKMKAAEDMNWILRQATGVAKAPFVAEFVKMIVESGEKVVLYGWHREVYSIWGDKLKEFKPAFYTGTESEVQKHRAREAFLNDETSVLIMSLRSGAGLDGLQGKCRTVVFGELDWSPGVHEQCIGRIYRDGQAEPVVAYFLISDEGSDPVVSDVLGLKRQQIGGIRDPHAALLEKSDIGEGNIKRLAESFLKRHGYDLPPTEYVGPPQLELVKPTEEPEETV